MLRRSPIHLHGRSASCNLPPLLQALNLAFAIRVGLTLHKVVIVSLASCPNEVRGAHQGSRGGADLLDWRYVGGHRAGVDEDMLVESKKIWLGHA